MRRYEGLKGFRKLVIGGCDSLISLPRSIKYLITLEEFYIIDCEKLDLTTIKKKRKRKKNQPPSLPLRIVIFGNLLASLALPEQLL